MLAADGAAGLRRHQIVEILDKILGVLDIVGLAVHLDGQWIFGKAGNALGVAGAHRRNELAQRPVEARGIAVQLLDTVIDLAIRLRGGAVGEGRRCQEHRSGQEKGSKMARHGRLPANDVRQALCNRHQCPPIQFWCRARLSRIKICRAWLDGPFGLPHKDHEPYRTVRMWEP
ncbi:hypothetical protein RHE_CH02746 [Rhizobium etli CFN 42]|uniref:Uncharacterized protein n=1 Tax=Rhizobium etli (strain ATCC 51251 / DSM 11541 / JCM 21823 / NBRC 15573 / CFN 42) TaxID=347834 RepID=Q2K6M0_RHIEC|nr:hypothetical protein RHE_CH02746 [Rhizobium etli CFN 42]